MAKRPGTPFLKLAVSVADFDALPISFQLIYRMLTRTTALAVCLLSLPAAATTFQFGANANGLEGLSSANLTVDGLTLQMTAGPAGAVFSERGRAGLGIDSRGIDGVVQNEVDKFDLPNGDATRAESLTFTFDQPGQITSVDFDGVKDEALEYFVLTTESGRRIEFFDSAANLTVPGAVDAAVSAGVVTGEIVYFLEDAIFDDDAIGLSIAFAAGETLTLTYAELGTEFGPLEAGNGARFTGFTVESIPEPASGLLLLIATLCRVRR